MPEHYHFHVYFDPPQRPEVLRLRQALQQHFPVAVGRVHDRPVGPHTAGMFQVSIHHRELGDVLAYLMIHRGELDVLLHPETGHELDDHSRHAVWLGRRRELRLDMLAAPRTN